ncbi:1902_t:CDS:2, partial [Entrophospora sp. SA101]
MTLEQKALQRYSASRIIDLSSSMKDYFTEDEQKKMKCSINIDEFKTSTNNFIMDIEKLIDQGETNQAYLRCLDTHIHSEINTELYKISKVYGDLYTETDIIVKSVEYIINGLTPDFDFSQKWGESFSPPSKSENYTRGQRCDVCILSTKGKDLAEWEFSQHITPVKIITDRCRSNRVNQAILNSLFKIEQLEDHVDIKVQYVQMAGINERVKKGKVLKINSTITQIDPKNLPVLERAISDFKEAQSSNTSSLLNRQETLFNNIRNMTDDSNTIKDLEEENKELKSQIKKFGKEKEKLIKKTQSLGAIKSLFKINKNEYSPQMVWLATRITQVGQVSMHSTVECLRLVYQFLIGEKPKKWLSRSTLSTWHQEVANLEVHSTITQLSEVNSYGIMVDESTRGENKYLVIVFAFWSYVENFPLAKVIELK